MQVARGERFELHLGDSRDVLPRLAKNISLVVTDPPYGVNYHSNMAGRKVMRRGIEGDLDAEFVYDILDATIPLYQSNDQHMYVFGDFNLQRVRTVDKSIELVWDKTVVGMGNLDVPWSVSYEHIQFAVIKQTTKLSGGEKKMAGGLIMRKRKQAVLRQMKITGVASKRHPTEKPVLLLRDLIEASSRMDDVILDPFNGSGSTGVAAILEGRRYVGVELESRHYTMSVSRLRRAEELWNLQRGV